MASNKLASDLDNTDFVGATNPDDQLFVQFYEEPLEIRYKSAQAGHPVYEMRDFIKIHTPGSELNKVVSVVEESHKRRFPRQWAHYQNTKQNAPVEGWALEKWPQINAAQVKELKYHNVFTVEMLAGLPFGTVQGLGMGYVELQEQAKIAMKAAKDASFVTSQAAELAKRDKEIEVLKEQMAQLMADKKGPGRPKRVAE